MIILRVKQVARERGIEYIKDLAERAGLAYDTAADLWHGRMQRIDRDVLSRVCAALNATPCDLLVYEPGERIIDDSEEGPEGEELPTASSLPTGPSSFVRRPEPVLAG